MSPGPEFDLWPHCRGITAQVLVKGACGWHEGFYHAALLSMLLPTLFLVTSTVFLQMLDHSCLTATCCTVTMLALCDVMTGGRE